MNASKQKNETFDVTIVGAGAAGLMCALRAAQRGRKVLVLERSHKVGAKILISGGGRCNFTNLNIFQNRFLSNNPHFCISALKSYTQHDFIALVQKHKIAYHEKTLGQLFCDTSAKDIVDMLLNECQSGHVEIRVDQHVTNIQKADAFNIQTQTSTINCQSLVLATGGLSIPKMGATNFSHQIAEKFGLTLTDIRPALVPLTFLGQELSLQSSLAGVSLEVVASCGKNSFRENMIFTHRGLSGPAILQISSYWHEGQTLSINLLPDLDIELFLLDRKRNRPKATLKSILSEVLPQRLALALATQYMSPHPIGALSVKELKHVAQILGSWILTPTGTEGYGKAEVTLGGISTQSLSSKTMEVSTIPGLYIIGEAVDVTGWLGGYNFQWAWSSGWAAGSAI